MKKSFKIKKGFGIMDFILITPDELPKAYYSFIFDTKFMSKTGDIAHKVFDIVPDWHGIMGWNLEHPIGGRELIEIGSHRMQKAEAYKIAAMEIAKRAGEENNMMILEQPMMIEMGQYVLPDKKKLLESVRIKK